MGRCREENTIPTGFMQLDSMEEAKEMIKAKESATVSAHQGISPGIVLTPKKGARAKDSRDYASVLVR